MTDVALYNQPHTAVLYVDDAMIPVVVGGDTGPAGAVGPQGPQGVKGDKGDPGKQVLNGTAPPTAGIGLDGDFYIDTTADAIYGPKTAGAWGPPTSLIGPVGPQGIQGIQGVKGDTGAQGPRGYSVLSGAGAPTMGIGIDGDFFINTSANTIYGPKTAGSWGGATSLVGPQGPQGATGAASTVPGPQGPMGPRGYSVLNGAGAPAAGAGVDGDFYINTSANTIYGPKTAGAWGSPTSMTGPQGAQGVQGVQGVKGDTGNTGAQGVRGLSVLNGTSPPAPAAGLDGEFFIDTTADAIYRPKTGGAWGPPTSMIGPQGPVGPEGPQGVQGLPGAGSTSDLVYGPTWNGVGNVSPSQNAMYDKIESILDGQTFTGAIVVPDQVYQPAWDGNFEVPTKNAIYDKINSLALGVTDGDKGDVVISGGGTVYKVESTDAGLNVGNGVVSFRTGGPAGTEQAMLYASSGEMSERAAQFNFGNLAASIGYATLNSGGLTVSRNAINHVPPAGQPAYLNLTTSGGAVPTITLNGTNPTISLAGDVNSFYPTIQLSAQNGAVVAGLTPYGGMMFDLNTGQYNFRIASTSIVTITSAGLDVAAGKALTVGGSPVALTSALAAYVPKVTAAGTNSMTANGASSKIYLTQTGGTYGSTSLTILSEGTVHGAQFSSGLGVVDFSFSVLGGSSNFRYERRVGSKLAANAWEFQLGLDTAPELRLGPSANQFVGAVQIAYATNTAPAGFGLDVNSTARFVGAVTVPAEAYGASWAAKLEAPTKKDLYDKIQTLPAAGSYLPLAGGQMAGNIGFNSTFGFVMDTPASALKVRLKTLTGVSAWGGFLLGADLTGSGLMLDDTSKNGWFFKLDARSNVGDVLNGMWAYRVPQGANPHTDETAMFGVTNGFAYFRQGLSIGNSAAIAAPAGGAALDVTGAATISSTLNVASNLTLSHATAPSILMGPGPMARVSANSGGLVLRSNEHHWEARKRRRCADAPDLCWCIKPALAGCYERSNSRRFADGHWPALDARFAGVSSLQWSLCQREHSL